MPEYTVKQGDCASSIADKHGLFWETVWNHPKNSKLKDERQDPNVLQPGDVLFVPDKEEKEASCATEQCHKFCKKGVPAKMKLQLMMEDEPLANQPFTLIMDKQIWLEGTTDGDGYVEASIPPEAKNGEIIVGPFDNRISFGLDFGTLDPLDTDEGILKRLINMGYALGDDQQSAVAAFQTKEGLTVTGTIDQATRDQVKKVFGQ